RRIPDVLADVGGDGRVADNEHGRLDSGLEVPVLVEDAVVRQVLLVVDAGHRAVVQHRGRVEDVVALVDEADDRGEPGRRPGDVRERSEIRLNEGGFEQEVLGRVRGDDQLGDGE